EDLEKSYLKVTEFFPKLTHFQENASTDNQGCGIDESKIGQKLLTKMGWKRGKGLGRNEDGITENIKVKFKGSNAGIGWKDESFLGAQNEEFDAVLENLNKNYLSTGKELSKDCEVRLVQRCKKFRERFHYRRFVKEDISKYSEKEMKGIFIGMKTQVEEEEPLCEKSSTSNLQNTSLENNSSDLTTTYNSSSSIADYFAQKMKKKAGNFLTSTSIHSKELNSNCTWPLLSNEIQESSELIQESLPNDIVIKNEKRKKSQKNSKFKKHKLSKISKSCLKRVAYGNKTLVKMKKNVSFNNIISYHEIPVVSDEDSATSNEEITEFQNLDNENNVDEQIPSEISYVQNFKHNEENEKFDFNEICSNNHCVSNDNDLILNKSGQSSGDIISKKVGIERSSDNSNVVHLEEIQKHTCNHVTSNANCIESTLLNITQEQNEFVPESSNSTIVKSKKRKKSSKNSKSKNCKLDTVSEFMSCLESVTNGNKFLEKVPKNAFLNNSISSQEISFVSGEDHEVSMKTVTGLKDTDDKNGTVEQKFSKNSNLPDCGFSKRNKVAEFVKINVNNHCKNLEKKLALNDHSAGDTTTKKEDERTTTKKEHERMSEVHDYSGNTYFKEVQRKANSTSNYNSWLESQRIAMKMNIYKSMREKIKNHRVLSTTNLLQIKGYGNWGF
ncbi:protein PFC0760c-like, partial [Stegodyphus dumicola]|uniref:protein PFC0760c-like n=1 Tax=Stegodyphus dumicola TaxID=202533 RepID=UPI0015AEE143